MRVVTERPTTQEMLNARCIANTRAGRQCRNPVFYSQSWGTDERGRVMWGATDQERWEQQMCWVHVE